MFMNTDPRDPVTQVTGLRTFSDEGTLVLPPFRSEAYRQDVHAVIYRCIATNPIGSITSRDVHVSAGMVVETELALTNSIV